MQNGAGALNGQDGDVIGLFHPQKERVHFLEANLDKLSFQHKQVGYIIGGREGPLGGREGPLGAGRDRWGAGRDR